MNKPYLIFLNSTSGYASNVRFDSVVGLLTQLYVRTWFTWWRSNFPIVVKRFSSSTFTPDTFAQSFRQFAYASAERITRTFGLAKFPACYEWMSLERLIPASSQLSRGAVGD
jgi:hypothetical protein